MYGKRMTVTEVLDRSEAGSAFCSHGGITLIVRNAYITDIEQVAAVESLCFPPSEAASRESLEKRIRCYGNHFWLMFDEERLISFVDGLVTDLPDLTDEMYENAAMHNENGDWQMIFGVCTVPEYRGRGFASGLLKTMIQDVRDQGRKGAVLTCKNELVVFYEKFGFANEGITPKSVHVNVQWNQMRLLFR